MVFLTVNNNQEGFLQTNYVLIDFENAINNLFTENLKDKELQVLLRELRQQGYVKINEGNVSYKLPRNIP